MSTITPGKRKLLSRLLKKKGLDVSNSHIPRRAESDSLPLSFAQQRLWFLDQLTPGVATYNVPVAVRLTGRLDAAALERALTEVVRRHESLRTRFAEVDGRPVQLIEEAAPVRLYMRDLSGIADEEEREAEASRLVGEEAAEPFNLSTGPVLRAGLVKLSEDEHIALLTMHHIVSDGWSMGVLVREVAALYDAFSRGEESPLLTRNTVERMMKRGPKTTFVEFPGIGHAPWLKSEAQIATVREFLRAEH